MNLSVILILKVIFSLIFSDFLKSVCISLPKESISIVSIFNMSEEQLGKMAKDQENFQLESQIMIPPLAYPRSVPMIPLPIPFVQNPCQNPVST